MKLVLSVNTFVPPAVVLLVLTILFTVQMVSPVFAKMNEAQINEGRTDNLRLENVSVGWVSTDDILFSNTDKLSISLTGPFKTLSEQRDKKATHPGTLTYVDQVGNTISLDVGIRVRGNFRLDRSNCENPPLRLLFNPQQVKGTVFEHQKRLKMVLACKNWPKYNQYVVLEYLIYRTFNLLSDASFRVKLLEIGFNDSAINKDARVLAGFFIEDNKRLGKRLKKKRYPDKDIWISELVPMQTARLNLFQYLVGNTDFSTLRSKEGKCCHNVKLYQAEDDLLATSIPYDFDFTGLVNAPYAVPNKAAKINNVRSRRYRGFCEHNDLVRQQVSFFIERRQAIESLYSQSAELSQFSKTVSRQYLKSFYSILGSPESVERKILKYCR
ncbi:MAG: hypothetical protein KUG79_14290 [Pseudomonadales bacterium]|nr:hypothetical protein [Pseudomonadales bacterium]